MSSPKQSEPGQAAVPVAIGYRGDFHHVLHMPEGGQVDSRGVRVFQGEDTEAERSSMSREFGEMAHVVDVLHLGVAPPISPCSLDAPQSRGQAKD